jgi:hypothetical protein
MNSGHQSGAYYMCMCDVSACYCSLVHHASSLLSRSALNFAVQCMHFQQGGAMRTAEKYSVPASTFMQ